MVEAAHEPKFNFWIFDTKYTTLVVDFKAVERISAPFQVDLSLASEDEIEFDKVVGKQALLTILGAEEDRYIHGIVNKFMQNGSKGRFYLYEARIVPSLWLLSLEQDCRIFQNEKVEDIVKKVLQERGITSDRFDFKLQNKYPEREYCVQYRETDLNFISRLLEEEGIFYCFEHFEDKHLLIFGDSPVAYQPIKGTAEVTFNASVGMVPEEECLFRYTYSRRILSGKFTQQDFNFEKPAVDLTTQEQADSYQKLEVYDYPGRYLDQGRGKKLTQVRLQEYLTFKELGEGQSSCVRMIPGFTFKLTDNDRDVFNKEYLLVEVLTTGAQPQAVQEETYSGLGLRYSNEFQCISR